jgi:hypothetical protein
LRRRISPPVSRCFLGMAGTVLDRELRSALAAAANEHSLTGRRLCSRSEAVCFHTLSLFGLICSLGRHAAQYATGG